MLFGCFFENSSHGNLLSKKMDFGNSINNSDLVNHCSSHNSDCSATETECNICHSAHCVYIATPGIHVSFIKANPIVSLKAPQSYYFSYLSVLLRPPIS